MTISFRTLAVVLTAVLAAACSSDPGDADARVAELEKQLADTQKKLADGATSATDTSLPPPARIARRYAESAPDQSPLRSSARP